MKKLNSNLNSGRIVLSDPSLINESGHCLSYIQSLKKHLEKNKDIIVVGNRGVSKLFSEQYEVIPGFTYWIDHRASSNNLINESIHRRTIKDDLSQIDQRVDFKGNDIFFINSLRQWQLQGVLEWAESLDPDKLPNIVLIFHFTAFPKIGESEGWDKIYIKFFERLELSHCRDKFKLFADSEELLAEYENFTNLEIKLAPIPHTPFSNRPARRKSRKSLTICYFGEARINKGFHLLPYAVNKLNAVRGCTHKFNFKIMSFCADKSAFFYKEAISLLKSFENVECIEEILSPYEYEKLLHECDIAILPYLTDSYWKQTSGVLSEVVVAGSVPIVSKGTWLSTQVNKYRLGLTFPPSDYLGLYQAMSFAVENFSEIKSDQIRGIEDFSKFHNIANFCNCCFGGDWN